MKGFIQVDTYTKAADGVHYKKSYPITINVKGIEFFEDQHIVTLSGASVRVSESMTQIAYLIEQAIKGE